MNLISDIKNDILFYEAALANPQGAQADFCKKQYGRMWKKQVLNELQTLKEMLADCDKLNKR